MVKFLVHYGIHLLVPIFIALIWYRERWIGAALIMLAAMAIDLDHLLASPVFESGRCSIGFHPLHSYWAIMVYMVMLIFPKTRLPAIGLLIHILADIADCYL